MAPETRGSRSSVAANQRQTLTDDNTLISLPTSDQFRGPGFFQNVCDTGNWPLVSQFNHIAKQQPIFPCRGFACSWKASVPNHLENWDGVWLAVVRPTAVAGPNLGLMDGRLSHSGFGGIAKIVAASPPSFETMPDILSPGRICCLAPTTSASACWGESGWLALAPHTLSTALSRLGYHLSRIV